MFSYVLCVCGCVCLYISEEESIRQIDRYADICLDGRQTEMARLSALPSPTVWEQTHCTRTHTHNLSVQFSFLPHTHSQLTLCSPQRPDRLLLSYRNKVKVCPRELSSKGCETGVTGQINPPPNYTPQNGYG